MALTKRRVLLVALAIVAIAMPGCKIRQTVAFNDDGSGTFTYLVGIEKDVLDDLGVDDPYERVRQQVEERDFPVELERYETADLTGFRLSFEFESVEDLKDKLNVGENPSGNGQQTIQEIALEMGNDGWDLSGAVGAPSLDSGEDLPIDVSELEERLDMEFSITMPGEPGDSNADDVQPEEDSTTFVWALAPGQSGSEIAAATKLPESFPVLLVVGAGLAALMIAVVIWVLIRRRRPAPVPEQ
jgi:hypothetical protein